MQALVAKSETTLRHLADSATVLRDDVYNFTLRTPLGPLVVRINKFLTDNTTLIFWGGATLFFATHPPFFMAGFGIGLVVGSMLNRGASALKDVNFTALKQIIKCIIFVVSAILTVETRCFLAGITPGFHTYNLFQGIYYGNTIKGFAAIGEELNRMCWELAHWIPFLDVNKHPQLFAPALIPEPRNL